MRGWSGRLAWPYVAPRRAAPEALPEGKKKDDKDRDDDDEEEDEDDEDYKVSGGDDAANVGNKKDKDKGREVEVDLDPQAIIEVVGEDEQETLAAAAGRAKEVPEEERLVPLEVAPVAGDAPTFVYMFADIDIDEIRVPDVTTRGIVEEGVLQFVDQLGRSGYNWGIGCLKVCARSGALCTLIESAHRLQAIRRLLEQGGPGFTKAVGFQVVSRSNEQLLSAIDIFSLRQTANAGNVMHNPTTQTQHVHWMGNMVCAMQRTLTAVAAAGAARTPEPAQVPAVQLRIASANVTGIVAQIEEHNAVPVCKTGKPLAPESLKRL